MEVAIQGRQAIVASVVIEGRETPSMTGAAELHSSAAHEEVEIAGHLAVVVTVVASPVAAGMTELTGEEVVVLEEVLAEEIGVEAGTVSDASHATATCRRATEKVCCSLF